MTPSSSKACHIPAAWALVCILEDRPNNQSTSSVPGAHLLTNLPDTFLSFKHVFWAKITQWIFFHLNIIFTYTKVKSLAPILFYPLLHLEIRLLVRRDLVDLETSIDEEVVILAVAFHFSFRSLLCQNLKIPFSDASVFNVWLCLEIEIFTAYFQWNYPQIKEITYDSVV